MFWNPCSCSGWQRTQSQPSVSSFLASRFNFYLSGFNSSQRETFNTWYVHHNFSPHGPWLSMLAVLQVASAMFRWYLASFLQVHDLECNFDIAGVVGTFVEHLFHRKLNILPLPGSQKNSASCVSCPRFSDPSSSSCGSNARIALHHQAPQPCSVPSARMGPLDEGSHLRLLTTKW